MELRKILESRQSVRGYLDKPVEAEKLQTVLNASSQAPSAGSLQAFEIHIVRSLPERRGLAAAAYGQDFMVEPPIVLVFCADPTRAAKMGQPREENYSAQDAIIAAAYAQLAATDEGLATCWIGGFDSRSVARTLRLAEHLRPVVLLPLGYAAETPAPASRRPFSELIIDRKG